MCGIAGFVSSRQSPGTGFLGQASELLRHRGPDDEGYLLLDQDLNPQVAFGPDTASPELLSAALPLEGLAHGSFSAGLMHRRLAIIAPDPGGHQPMGVPGRKIWLSFNGEIYNFLSLREELRGLGYSFQTRTDTEVLLNAWLCWGPECLPRLDGMWAFALLDAENHRFFAATDSAGVKPFYYRSEGEQFFFASEIKALLHQPFSQNREQIARYLIWGQSDEGAQTLFSQIQRLEGGQYLELSLKEPGKPQLKRWFRPEVNTEYRLFREEEFRQEAAGIRDMLKETVTGRLQADVPLGLCLSGGIDSSAIAGLVSTLAPEGSQLQLPGTAFMAVLPEGQKPDESAFARKAAEAAGLELFTTCPDPDDFLRSVKDIIYTLDSPPPGMNAFSQYAVFRLVSEKGIKVTLDGQGADELFGGYPAHLEAALLENLLHGRTDGFRPELFGRMLANQFREFLPGQAALPLLLKKKPELGIFRPEVFALAGEKQAHTTGLNQRLFYDYSSGILPFLLKAADRSSMRWSVESRMPFADSGILARHLFSLPGSIKIRGGESKSLLREAMHNLVPAAILQRRDKVGYAAPNRTWLTGLLKPEFTETLPSCPEWIDEEAFNRHAQRFLKNSGTDPLVLWRALAFRIWLSIFQP